MIADTKKTNEVSRDQFRELVMANVPSDVKTNENIDHSYIERVIGVVFDSSQKLSLRGSLTRALNKIKEAVELADAETVDGVVVGARDMYGSKGKTKFYVVRKQLDSLEVSSWKKSLPTAGGKQPSYPFLASIKVRYDEEYNQLDVLGVTETKPVSKSTFINGIKGVADAFDPSTIREEDKKTTVVVFRGMIKSIYPNHEFVEDGLKGDGSKKWVRGDPMPVLLPNEDGVLVPNMQIQFVKTKGVVMRGSLERTRNVLPEIHVMDLVQSCEDAVEVSGDPIDQASHIADILDGREVIVVGIVSNVSKSAAGSFVDVRVAAIYDHPDAQNSTLTMFGLDSKSEDVVSEPEPPKPKPTPAKKMEPETVPTPEPAVVEKGDGEKEHEYVRRQISSMLAVVGGSPESLTVDYVVKNVAPGAKEAVVQVVINQMIEEYNSEHADVAEV